MCYPHPLTPGPLLVGFTRKEKNMSWEESFTSWAKPPGQTEQTKCDNAVGAVRKAIDASASLKHRSIKVFAQGSYCNRTNVRQDSDVDVCILCTEVCFVDYSMSDGLTDADVGLTNHPYTYPEYKNDVGAALIAYFGNNGVTRGKKAFDIHENTYRIDADAVACFEHRRYQKSGSYLAGTAFDPDGGSRIVNWPDQNYENGVAKNKSTGGRFKDIVRILKRLRNKMADDKIAAAGPIPSFLIECLVWNVPNDHFGHTTYKSDVREALAFLFNNTMKFDDCKEWGEINELKYLFWSGPPWTYVQAHNFISAAWDYLGLE
jgi:hypothetical protein